MIKIRKIFKDLRASFIVASVFALTFVLIFNINTSGVTKEDNKSNDFAVVVKDSGLWLVNLSIPDNEVLIDNGGVFKNPKISPDGDNVAYTKGEDLYIATANLIEEEREVIKVSEKIVSYNWSGDSEIVYSTENGGLNSFNIKSKKTSTHIESNDRYEGILADGHGTIYGEKYRYYTKDNEEYIESKGIISYKLDQGEEKLIIPSDPINYDIEDLGLLPKVAGISKDGSFVYIWCKVHSASMNADGVGFGVYDVKNNNFTAFDKDKIMVLAYKDNLAINPIDGRRPVLNIGGGRNMNINKTLGVLDVIEGDFTPILPKSMTGGNIPYGIAVKGMVTMTPSFSRDGRKIVFSASQAVVEMEQWAKMPHNIFVIDMETKKVEKITKGNSFDFAPIFASNEEKIIFARKDQGDYISLWRIKDGKEEIVSKDIKLSEYSWYYGHYNLEESLDIY